MERYAAGCCLRPAVFIGKYFKLGFDLEPDLSILFYNDKLCAANSKLTKRFIYATICQRLRPWGEQVCL